MTTTTRIPHAMRKTLRLALSATLTLVLLTAGCTTEEQAANDGALTGEGATDTLSDAGTTSMNDGATSLTATLTGEEEVPGPGDPDGSGSAEVQINAGAGEVCYEIEVNGIDEATMAHIHRGAQGESGPPVVDFNVQENGLDSCVTASDAAVVQEIVNNPAGFYVNVHNEAYPAGAVRGQLGS